MKLPGQGDMIHELKLVEGRTLTGRVIDSVTEKPIVGARVGMNWVLTPEVKTDEDGRYALHGWTGKGVSDIHVLAEGYGRERADVGARAEIDFRLARGNSIKGTVLDKDGKPIPAAKVCAIGSSFGSGGQMISMDSGLTNEHGRFLLEGLRRDMPHTLIVIARGHAKELRDFDPSPADVLDVGRIRLDPPCTLLGKIVDGDGNPMPRIRVTVAGANDDRDQYRIGGGGPAQTSYGAGDDRFSDDLGRFRVTGLAPATYKISVHQRGASGIDKSVEVESVEVEPGAEPTEITIVLDQGREVKVTVTDAQGKPLEGMRVSAYAAGVGSSPRLAPTTTAWPCCG